MIRSDMPKVLVLLAAAWLTSTPSSGQIYKLSNPDEASGDYFGASVAIDERQAVIGASGSSACGENSGAVYVFEADSSSGHWNHSATLVPNDCAPGDFFGRSLSMSGNHLIVASYRPSGVGAKSNAAYIFERDSTGKWNEHARFEGNAKQSEGAYAAAVAIDGSAAVVTTSGDAVSGRYHGAAYFYERLPSGDWLQKQRLVPRQSVRLGIFGTSVDMADGVTVVGASTYLAGRPGSLYLIEFEQEADRWQEVMRFGGLDDFFLPVDISGNRIIVGERRAGEEDSGAAVVIERDLTASWRKSAILKPVDPFELGAFGSEVALGSDRALVVGYDEQLRFEFNIDRVVYVFENREGGRWRQRHVIDVGDVAFGSDIDTAGSIALIGQASDTEPGSAYIVHIH